jgi:hypothetical protein
MYRRVVRFSKTPFGFRAISLYLGVGLQVILSAWPASNIVLCRAEDGHVTIEPAHDGTPCLRDFRRHHPTDPVTDEIDGHRCTDTALTSAAASPAAARSHRTAELQLPILVAFLQVVSVDPVLTPAHRYALREPTPDSERSLRTTVLLI